MPFLAPIIAAAAIEIGATAAAAAVIGAVGSTLVGVGVSVGLGIIAQKLFAPKATDGTASPETPSGAQSSLTIGASVPRNAIIGRQATAGQFAYWNLYGPNNEFLQLVYVLGTGPHDGLDGIYVNGTACSFGTVVPGADTPVTDFSRDGVDYLWFRFFNGFYDQDADARLIENANPPGRWTEDFRGRGICYVSVTVKYSPEVFPNGIPQFLFVVRGLRLYDRRKDSTNGGSGAHRWSDQHTWEHSENPALGLYLFERGLYVGDQKQIGRGLAPVDLISDFFTSSANVCDETVTNKDASTEPRYRIGMNVGADRDWSGVEHDFTIAMGGWMMESAGAYGPIAGSAQPVVFEFTDKDLIVGREVSYAQKRSRSELINTVFGTYTDPNQNWTAVPYPARSSSSDLAADGSELAVQRDYPMLSSGTQVQRIGEIERRLSRHQATGGVTLGFNYSNVEQGDWGQWTSARRDFTTLFQVTRVVVDDDDSTTLSLREISEDVFDFDEDVDELDPLNPGDLPGINALITTVADFSLEAVTLTGTGGLKQPGLRAQWSPVHDRTVTDVVVQYRLAAQPDDITTAPPFEPVDGEGVITAGIQGGETGYEARATIITEPPRVTTWTGWVSVTSPLEHVVSSSQSVVPGGLTVEALSQQVTALFGAVERSNKRVSDFIASKTADIMAAEYLDRADIRNSLEQVRGNLSASVTTASETAFSTAGSLADYKIEVASNFGDVNSAVDGVVAGLGALTGPDGAINSAKASAISTAGTNSDTALANYENQLVATTGRTRTAIATENLTAVSTIQGQVAAAWGVNLSVEGYVVGLKLVNGGQTTGAFAVTAPTFIVGYPGVNGGDPTPMFTVGLINGVPRMALRGDALIDGSIFARNMTADSITTNNLVADAAAKVTSFIDPGHAFSYGGNNQRFANGVVVTSGFKLVVTVTINVQKDFGAGIADARGLDLTFGVYMDGGSQKVVNIGAIPYSADYTAHTFSVRHQASATVTFQTQPGAGAHTFEIFAFGAGGAASVNVDNSITVLELKRTS